MGIMKTIVLTVSLLAATFVNAQILPGKIVDPVRSVTSQLPDITEEVRERSRPTRALLTDTLESVPERLHVVPDTLRLISEQGDIVIEEGRDRDGELVLAGEWLLFADSAITASLAKPGIKVISERRLEALSLYVIRIKVTDALNNQEALNQQLPEGVTAQWVKHHIYLSQAALKTADNVGHVEDRVCSMPFRMGMVDTSIDTSHPLLDHVTITQRSFHIQGTKTSHAHGTAVAAIAAGRLPNESHIVNAGVFYSRSSISQGATLLSLVEGINYLAKAGVSVINFSLTGPANPLLAKAVKRLRDKGILLAAAAGNDGPAATPRYPAAYDDVIAVTAIDDKDSIYRWANQGDYIELAGPGVSVTTARPNGEIGSETGTSMAAPLVSAIAGCHIALGESAVSTRAILRQQATDLGEKGRDPVYGYGAIK